LDAGAGGGQATARVLSGAALFAARRRAMRPPLRVVNVGGSLTTALVLSAVAWGVRLLRAKNILRPAERPSKPAARASSKALFGRLSPLAFRLLVRARCAPAGSARLLR
jgi:hypothetical protein